MANTHPNPLKPIGLADYIQHVEQHEYLIPQVIDLSLIAEIEQAIQHSVAKLPVFPSVSFMQIERIENAFAQLGYTTCQEPYAENCTDDYDTAQARKDALAMIAELVRYVKALPKP